uniref:Late embryogenesis abundant protein n=1 Tax=Romanomermis culicivorax TaxID=13658 RepID=A0A915JA79_ROMCU
MDTAKQKAVELKDGASALYDQASTKIGHAAQSIKETITGKSEALDQEAKEAFDSGKEKCKETYNSAKEGAKRGVHATEDKVDEAREKASSLAQQASDKLKK